ncbi:S-adenosyl-L-methionine-dependent methyltransferase [Phlyctochytrium arcticum]|nr:S-adenosyl-L-methionine-dependent methyltransferase [Phlyctochytrium arcticum]
MAIIPSLSSIYEPAIDAGYVPDFLLRRGVRHLLSRRVKQLAEQDKAEYISSLKAREAIGTHTQEANEQHYEVPTEFFALCLGDRMKYSSCLYENGAETLEEAEVAMLDLYMERSGMRDGLNVLDLGCGWGSLSLYLAERYPNAKITGLSNSSTQRTFILSRAAEKSLSNLNIVTADITTFNFPASETPSYDLIFSIEMFEHMKNYSRLLEKVSKWLKPETGRLFVHVFAHKDTPYDFRTEDDNSWMAKYFFTGGTMPSVDLFEHFQEDLTVLQKWVVNGENYGKTSEEWLRRMDINKNRAMPILEKTYGAENAAMWFYRWRVFYVAVAELFNYNKGEEWVVVHYLFKRK